MAAAFRMLRRGAPSLGSLRMTNDGPHLVARALTCPPLAISGRTAALLAPCTALTSLLLQVTGKCDCTPCCNMP